MATIGTDPELLLVSAEDNGAFISSLGRFKGTKKAPVPMGLGTGYALQCDNVALEFNVPPASDPAEFGNSISAAMQYIRALVSEQGLVVSTSPEGFYEDAELRHPLSKSFGCVPDLDAHARCKASAVSPTVLKDDVREGGRWHLAGGHVHVGYTTHQSIPHFVAGAFADVFIGLPSIGRDTQERRRAHYGQPGRYRVTPFGIEYRTLSGYWVHSEYQTGVVAKNALRLAAFLEGPQQKVRSLYASLPWADIRQAISSNDEAAAVLLRTYIGREMGNV